MSPPFGYQSGYHPPQSDDSYPASFLHDPTHNLLYFTGVTYTTFFDAASINNNLSDEVLGAMGMSMTSPSEERGSGDEEYHLSGGDCFFGILKLPTSNDKEKDSSWWSVSGAAAAAAASPKLIYARRFGTPRNSEACSSLISLPHEAVNDALLQSSSQMKVVLLGHVTPEALSEVELEQFKQKEEGHRSLQQQSNNNNNINQGGFFTSLSEAGVENGPLTHNGRAYGFLMDFDVSLTPEPQFSTSSSTSTPNNLDMNYAYGALLGGHVLESTKLVYPIDLTQNARDPNQLYVVSMNSDNDKEVYNPEYTTSAEQEVNAELLHRPDVTLGGVGGAGGGSASLAGAAGGVPKFGSDFYVKLEQVTLTPYQELLNVKPTSTEHVKRTMESGWGFGFKLDDADDVRPSCLEFVKGRTPNEDLLLMGGTTRKKAEDGSGVEYDGFVTKVLPPSPAPVVDMTTGATVEEAEAGMQNEGTHPTKRIDSISGRDETVTAICLPPSDAGGMGVSHAYIVGSSTNPEGGKNGPSMAYLLKMRLDDMSTVWKEHVTSISHDGDVGGDVLGQGCVVSHDGKAVYLSGTIDGTSGMRTGSPNSNVKPVGGVSDVFVAAYDAEFGNVKWEQQLGTRSEDRLARGGGIKVDNDGNPMIMGSTRGALQRPREGNGRMASDIFFMSLSRENGAYINAPFTTGNAASAIAASITSGSGKGIMIAGIVVAVISALLVVIVVRRRGKVTKRKEVSRMWDRSGDDFTFKSNASTSEGGEDDRTSSGALRIVRGGVDDEWDDGSDKINTDSLWTSVGSAGGKSSTKGFMASYSRKKDKEDASFLAKLREEASASSKKLSGMISDTTDPRVDGGASIKDMLSQYREVRKNNLMSSEKSSEKKTLIKGKAVPPPPPRPPPKSYEGEPDGLSEFTIV